MFDCGRLECRVGEGLDAIMTILGGADSERQQADDKSDAALLSRGIYQGTRARNRIGS